ncbi:uncharacterized protein LOC125775629 [Bactrocera dorsalis]|uniref:Uncharacterized protein LOC125775629 n=1 Tax=Bactrocera dorsalis TaxID=27457 RepID=A0ABM3IZ14_BACDO|nr:uncharacterized protein LOC125775629 [Bactrocera dorsalis]
MLHKPSACIKVEEKQKNAIVYLITQIAASNKKLAEIQKRRQLRLEKILTEIKMQNSLLLFVINNNKPKRLWKHERHGNFCELDVAFNSEQFFKESFRMSRESFKILCNELTNIGKRDTTYRQCIPLEKRIAIALYAFGSSAEHRTVGRLFGVSKASVCFILKDFCRAVWDILSPKYLASSFLTQEKITECVEGFRKIGFPQYLGANGCHIEIRPSASDAVDYFNYKGWYSMVLLALVDYR